MGFWASFIIATIWSFSSYANSSAITDVLLNPKATMKERLDVSAILDRTLGQSRPLPGDEALLEACYEVDICASKTDITQNECVPDEEFGPTPGDACYIKDIREKYLCSKEMEPMGTNGLMAFWRLMEDTKSLYSAYIEKIALDFYLLKFKVDLNQKEVREAFFKKHPEEKAKIQKIMTSSYALGAYTADCYMKLNSALYDKDQTLITRYFNLYSSVIDTMTVFPEYKGTVNRGVDLPQEVLKEHHKVGNIVCNQGFTSTAIHDPKTDRGDNPRNSFLSGKCTQRLYIKQEDNGAQFGRLISSGSIAKSENEVLFTPGACFRVDKVYPRTDRDGEDEEEYECEKGERYNFELTLVPSK